MGRNAIGGYPAHPEAGIAPGDGFDRHTRLLTDADQRLTARCRRTVVQSTQPAQRREPPELVAPAGNLEGVDVERTELLTLVGADGIGVFSDTGHQPTEPSIWSSMSRLSSRAYSIGNSRAIGSTKPRTTIAIASSSVMPRLIR